MTDREPIKKSGCLNGGGQIRYDDRDENKIILEKLISTYDNDLESRVPIEPPPELLDGNTKAEIGDLYTTFRIIPKVDDGIPTNW